MNKQDTIAGLKQHLNDQDFIMTRAINSVNQRRTGELLDVFHQTNSFGNFFYDEKNKLKPLLGSFLFDNISKYYEQWEDTYESIFEMIVVDKTARKLKLKKITPQEEDIIKAILDDLVTINEALKKQCETAFARLNALGDDKFT